jgi:hypothetical protein
MHERARASIAGGIAHDGRHQSPFPLYVSRADGAYKYDLDGKRLIDYAVGHGALILGHGDPDVLAAVHAQLDKGTHYGSGHEGEVAWAEQVRTLIPSAEKVRFVASGTEANILAMRLARSHTGRNTILKFEGHFHGWNDYLVKSEKPPFEHTSTDLITDELPQLERLQPELVSVLIGVNDVVRGVPDLAYAGNVAVILEELLTRLPPSRIVCVATPDYTRTPRGADYGDPIQQSDAIVRFNAILREASEQRRIAFVPEIFEISQQASEDEQLVASDGLHPSATQYARWVESIEPVVRELLVSEH